MDPNHSFLHFVPPVFWQFTDCMNNEIQIENQTQFDQLLNEFRIIKSNQALKGSKNAKEIFLQFHPQEEAFLQTMDLLKIIEDDLANNPGQAFWTLLQQCASMSQEQAEKVWQFLEPKFDGIPLFWKFINDEKYLFLCI